MDGTVSTGRSPPTDETALVTSSGVTFPREEALRTKREYISIDKEKLPGIQSFDNSTRLTDYFKDLMAVIVRGIQSTETSLDSTY